MKFHIPNCYTKLVSASIISSLLAACGGSSESSPPTPIEENAPVVINQPPVIKDMAAPVLTENSQHQITVTASDDDSEQLQFHWQQVSGVELVLANADSQTLTLSTPVVSELSSGQLQVTITDSHGASATEVIAFTVTNNELNFELAGQATSGEQHLIGANLEFIINDQKVTTTTDNQGNYYLEAAVDSNNSNYSYQLIAQGIDNQSHIKLVSTGLVSDLVPDLKPYLAGQTVQSAKVTASINNLASTKNMTSQVATATVNLNPLTTAEYQYLLSFFENKPELLNADFASGDAFVKKLKHIDSDLLLELASLLRFAADSGYDLAELTQLNDYLAFLADVLADDGGKSETFQQHKQAQKNEVNHRIADMLLPDTRYYATLASRPGTIRLGIGLGMQSFVFASDGSYVEEKFDSQVNANWQQLDNNLVVDLTNQPAVIETNVWLNDYDTFADCTTWPISKTYSPLKGNKRGVQHVFFTTVNETSCENSDTGFSTPRTTDSWESTVMLYRQQDMEPWQHKDIANNTLVFNHYSATAFDYNKSADDYVQAMSYQFFESGRGKVVEDNAEFTWQLTGGRLVMDFIDGYQIEWFKFLDDKADGGSGNSGAASSVFARYSKGEQFRVYQGMAVSKQEVSWAQADFVGQFNHGFNLSEPKNELFMNIFYFDLPEGGLGSVNQKDPKTFEHLWSNFANWYVQDNQIIITRNYLWDDNGWAGWSQCDPRYDENCYYFQYRSWQVLAKHGNRYYVKETLHHDGDLWSRGYPLSQVDDIPKQVRTNFYQPELRANK